MSLELHLFFDRIMKEHCFFLEVAFTEKDHEFKRIASDFKRDFSKILDKSIDLANRNVSESFLIANEMITDKTLEAENKTSALSGVEIDTSITQREKQLKSGIATDDKQLAKSISELNRQTLPLVKSLIKFKSDILNKVLSCKMYTTNYPLLINHIMNEAKMYHKLLTKIENGESFDAKYICEQELFWNNIMKEHAEFIRGMLDPSEKELILTADKYADEYEEIISQYDDYRNDVSNASLNETIAFRNFKIAGVEGILNCKIKSIIVPLLADHVLREANHFIRILSGAKNI